MPTSFDISERSCIHEEPDEVKGCTRQLTKDQVNYASSCSSMNIQCLGLIGSEFWVGNTGGLA